VGALDTVAEFVAVFLPHAISDMRVGAASFTLVHRWAIATSAETIGIVSPRVHFAEELRRGVTKNFPSAGPEVEWYELLRLYRNKAAHLGHQSWQMVGLENQERDVGLFLPRRWPFIVEQHASYDQSGDVASHQPVDFREYFEHALMHVDLNEYSDGAFRKVFAVVESALSVLFRLYIECGRQLDIANLAVPLKGGRVYQFQHFAG
jgi:hypothetical protein